MSSSLLYRSSMAYLFAVEREGRLHEHTKFGFVFEFISCRWCFDSIRRYWLAFRERPERGAGGRGNPRFFRLLDPARGYAFHV